MPGPLVRRQRALPPQAPRAIAKSDRTRELHSAPEFGDRVADTLLPVSVTRGLSPWSGAPVGA